MKWPPNPLEVIICEADDVLPVHAQAALHTKPSAPIGTYREHLLCRYSEVEA
jgi:hypothetical protein